MSGRDVEDKWQEAGLHPVEIDGTTAVEEAEEVFVCRKLYAQEMLPECFTDGGECDGKWYPDKRLPYDVHGGDRESAEEDRMKINSFCLTCLINMQESQVRTFGDEEKR